MQIMIYVFKTSVDNKAKFDSASVLLNELLPNSEWNFDLEDCDKILRVHGASISNPKIIELLNSYGFHCEALL